MYQFTFTVTVNNKSEIRQALKLLLMKTYSWPMLWGGKRDLQLLKSRVEESWLRVAGGVQRQTLEWVDINNQEDE